MLFQKAMRNLKPGNAAGSDKSASKIFECSCQVLAVRLIKILSDFRGLDVIPSHWCTLVTTTEKSV